MAEGPGLLLYGRERYASGATSRRWAFTVTWEDWCLSLVFGWRVRFGSSSWSGPSHHDYLRMDLGLHGCPLGSHRSFYDSPQTALHLPLLSVSWGGFGKWLEGEDDA